MRNNLTGRYAHPSKVRKAAGPDTTPTQRTMRAAGLSLTPRVSLVLRLQYPPTAPILRLARRAESTATRSLCG